MNKSYIKKYLKWRLRGTPRLTIWRKRQLRGPRVTFIIVYFFRIFNATKDSINTIVQKRLSREDTKLNCVCIIENGKINYYKRAGHSPKPTPWRVKGKGEPQLSIQFYHMSTFLMHNGHSYCCYCLARFIISNNRMYQNCFLSATILI